MLTPRRLTHQEYQKTILGPLDNVIQTMERRGVPVSLERLDDIRVAAKGAEDRYKNELDAWASKLGLADVNWNSPYQLLDVFEAAKVPRSPYNKKGLLPEDKDSTDDGAIEWLLAHAPEFRSELSTLREYRRAKRIVNYAVRWSAIAVPRDGYATLHPSFGLASDNDNRAGAVTGRFAIKEPPLNQVPSSQDKDKFGIKSAFIAPKGCSVIAVDASQLEVVLIADLATRLFGTRGMTDRLIAKADFHIFTAKAIFGDILGDQLVKDTPKELFKKNPHTKYTRDQAKNLRYGAHYLKGARAFGETLFTPEGDAIGYEQGEKLLNGLYTAAPELPLLKEWGAYWVKRYGVVSSALGRWRVCSGWDSPRRGEFNRACRIYANWYPQATGQEILSLALINIFKDPALKELGYVATLPVHDEILGYAPTENAKEAMELVKGHIINALELHAPLLAEGGVGESWLTAKP